MDDMLVFGDTHEQLEQRLEAVLKSIEDNGIRLNIEKCEFTKEKIHFLGYLISKDGFEADPSKEGSNNADGGTDKYFGSKLIPRNG